MKLVGMGVPEMLVTLFFYLIPAILLICLFVWIYKTKKNIDTIAKEMQEQTNLLKKFQQEVKES